jgi:fucose permease
VAGDAHLVSAADQCRRFGAATGVAANAYAARAFGPRRINLLHASYGVGAAASPLNVTAVIQTGATWRWAYAIVALLQFAGIESGVALWGFTYLTEAVGGSPAVAGGVASGFWAAMFVGRIVLGSLVERIGSWAVMGMAAAGMMVAAALTIAATPVTATAAYCCSGCRLLRCIRCWF